MIDIQSMIDRQGAPEKLIVEFREYRTVLQWTRPHKVALREDLSIQMGAVDYM